MKTDIALTLPCPLCPPPGRMLTATYEPAEMSPNDLPLLVGVSGCLHARRAVVELNGRSAYVRPVSPIFWHALHHEIEMYTLDCYTNQLESSAKYRRLREEC